MEFSYNNAKGDGFSFGDGADVVEFVAVPDSTKTGPIWSIVFCCNPTCVKFCFFFTPVDLVFRVRRKGSNIVTITCSLHARISRIRRWMEWALVV